MPESFVFPLFSWLLVTRRGPGIWAPLIISLPYTVCRVSFWVEVKPTGIKLHSHQVEALILMDLCSQRVASDKLGPASSMRGHARELLPGLSI